MAKYPNDDLFENTKMSFGEHLEELRVSLFRSVLFVIVGFIIGMVASKYVMTWMQSPLTRALKKFYVQKALDDLETLYGKDEVTDEVKQFVHGNELVFDDVIIEADEVNRLSRALRRVQAEPDVDTEHGTTPAAPESAAPESAAPESDAPKSDAKLTEQISPADKTEELEAKPDEHAVAEAAPGDDKSDNHKSGDAETNATTPAKSSPAVPIPSTAATVNPSRLNVDTEKIPLPHSNFVRTRIWKPVRMDVRSLNAQEAFMIWMKAGLISGVVFASPFVFWEIWKFVAAGLYPHEKNYVYIYLPFSLLLFLAGGSLAFFFVFDPVLDFLFGFNKQLGIDPDPRISEWLGFVLILPLGFGVSFQLPLVMLFLNRLGIFSLKAYVDKWRIAVLAIFVISAVLTPADPISIFLMAVPLTVLYFLGLGLCRWMPRGKNPFSEVLADEE